MLAGELLQDINTFGDAVIACEHHGLLTPDQARELTGFGLLPGDHKKYLVGVPFLIIGFEFKPGKDNSSFVECLIVTTHNSKYTLRDSSKGIHEQLLALHKQRLSANHPNPNAAYYARKGLTFMDHSYTGLSGEPTKSRTYYLAL
jgi:hypothetical protein